MSYNNYESIINIALNILLRDEMDEEVVCYSEFRKQDLKRGEYIRFWPGDSEPVSRLANLETRVYNYELSYYRQYSGDSQKKEFEKIISDRTNHLYYFLMGKSYHFSGGYKWHHIELTQSKATWGFDDEDKDICHVDFELRITRGNEVPNSPVITSGGDIV